jgi:netrin-G3 ligand
MFTLFLLFMPVTTVIGIQNQESAKIIHAPKDQVVVNERVASFLCLASGAPKPQIEWRKGGKKLVTLRYTVLEVPSGSVLRIEPVRPGRDNASYECLAENGVGEPVRASAELTVLSEDEIPKGFPKFSQQPAMQGIERGRSALITCAADGDPEPTITWFKDMIPIDFSNVRYTKVQGSSLQISNTEESDQGHYECIAENRIGAAFSNPAALYVRTRVVPPYFSIPPESVYELMPGSSINLTCVAVGSPMPTVTWKKDHQEISSPDLTSNSVGRNVLRLIDVQSSGNYTCVASSKLGDIESHTQVIVKSLPRPPTNVRVSDISPTTVKLTWSYDYGSENIIYFVIQFKAKNSKTLKQEALSEISGITTYFYVVSGLTPYTEYEFYIIAVNAIGRGPASIRVSATTGETSECI